MAAGNRTRVTFTSLAPRRLGGASLGALNEKLRESNNAVRATGMLLYYRQHFFGILEGAPDAVDAALDGFKQNRDLGSIKIASRKRVNETSFETWRLGIAATQIISDSQNQGVFALQDLLPQNSVLRGAAPEVRTQVRQFLASFPTLCGVKRTASGEAVSVNDAAPAKKKRFRVKLKRGDQPIPG